MSANRVCVLGDPRLQVDSRTEAIAGRPGRALVALVASEGGLSLDQLAETVWSGEPPKTARSALHVHLGALRKLFGAVPSGLELVRHGDRYGLSRSPDWELDVELAGLWSSRARECLAAEDPAAAVELFERTLALWSGPAFTVAGTEVAPAASYRMELVKLDLEEQLVEATLEAGDASGAEMRALDLVATEPYRERRWAQLMRARALQRRSADALATFDEARDVLVEDLGVEPGEELQRLQRSVLTRSDDLTGAGPAGEGRLDSPPLPLAELIGRAELLDRIEATLARPVPAVLVGAPGSGKTRLAVEVANRAAADGRDVGWIDLRNAEFADQAIIERLAGWARRHPGGLVAIDNAEAAVADVSRTLTTTRRVAPDVQVIVTSRVPVSDSAAVITVGPLAVPSGPDPGDVETSESVQFLRSMMELLAPGVEVEAAAAAELCRQLGGLPLAIRLAAELARSVAVPDLAAASRTRLGDDLSDAVEAALEYLGADHRTAFAAMSVVAGQLDRGLVAALIGRDDHQRLVSDLVDHGLAVFSPGEAAPYSIAEPLRDVGVSLLAERERFAALERLTDECLARAEQLTIPTPTAEDGTPLGEILVRELPWHRQVLAHLSASGDDQRALELAGALDLQLYSLGWWQENTDFQDAALAIPGAPSAPRAHVHAIRGRPGLFHQFDEEHNRIAYEMADRAGDPATRSRANYHLGIIRWWSGRGEEALELFQRAKEDAEVAGHVFLIGETTRFTGMALVVTGRAEEGLAVQVGLVETVERIPELGLLLPHLYMHLGHSRRHVGDAESALADLGRARAGFEEIDNRASLIHVCAGLAEVNADLGRHEQALEAAARSLDVSTGSAINVYDPWTLATTARVHAEAGDHDLARSAAAGAVGALGRTFDGETHRVSAQLAHVAFLLGEHHAALRLAGLAAATPDRRELPFRSPGEAERLAGARAGSLEAVGAEGPEILTQGVAANLTEAAGLLILPR